MSTAKVRLGIAFDGEKEVKSAISNINAQMKTLSSEAKLVAEKFKDQAGSEEALAEKSRVLSNQLEKQSEKYNIIKKAVKDAQEHEQKWADAIEKTKSAINGTEKKIEQLADAYGKNSTEVKSAESELDKLKSTLEKQENSLQKAKNHTEKWKDSLNRAETEVVKTENSLKDCERKMDSFGDEARDTANDVEKLEKASSGVGDKISTMGVAFGTFIGNIATDVLNNAVDKIKEFSASVVDLGTTFESSMSNVQALSGATGDELDQLEAKAREMGKSTVFSASEASDALGYMALAGWDTSQMLEGLDGVLKLAAAGGSDLATTSDIVTDNLSAFGMAASDSTKFADTMAYAMSKSNTTTEALGEAYSKCAATAKATGISFEETSAALMVLANSGIKGSEAGTSLNAIMARLTSNNKNVKGALKELNVSVYDSQGQMRSLSDIMIDVNKATENMTEKEKNLYVQQLAGVNHLSKFNTLLAGTSEEADKSGVSIASYTEQLKHCSGTAQEISDVMNDNLAGDLKTLNSAWEDFQLTLYDTAQGPMREIVQTTTNELIPALNALVSGADDAGEQITRAFSDIVSDIGNMAGDLVSVFFGDDAGQAVSNVIDTISGAIGQLMPVLSQLGEPIAKIIDAVSEVINNLLPPVVDIISNIVSHLSPIIEMITTIATSISKVLSPILDGLNFVLTPILEALDLFAQGMTAVWEGIGWLADGFQWLIQGCPEVAENFEEVSESAKKLNDEVGKNVDAWNDFIKAQEKTVGSSLGEIDNLEALRDELDKLVDKNGKVKKGYEARVEYITGKLSEATGVEIKVVDGTIQKYKNLKKAVEEALEAKKLEALTTYYQKILSNYEDGATQLQYDLGKTADEIDRVKDAMAKTTEGTDEWNVLKEELDGLETKYKALGDEVVVYAKTNSEYQQLVVAQAEGNTKKVNELVKNHTKVVETENGRVVASYTDQANGIEEQLKIIDQKIKEANASGQKETAKNLEELKKTYQEQLNTIKKEQADEQKASEQHYKNAFDMVKKHYDDILKHTKEKLNENSKTSGEKGKEASEKLADGLNNGKSRVENAANNLKTTTTNSLSGLQSSMYTTGYNASAGLANGIYGAFSMVKNAADQLAAEAERAANAKLQIKSPSRVFKKIGNYVGEGFALGIQESTYGVVKQIENQSDKVINSAQRGIGVLNSSITQTDSALSARSYAFDRGTSGSSTNAVSTIVRAIGTLNDTIKKYNDSGTRTTINGLTVKNDSNINSAVNDLVHAVTIGRRI